MKMAAQIAEEWTVGPIMASHLTDGGEDALIEPYFSSKLPFQHITPCLANINDVREPFALEMAAMIETDVSGGPDIVTSPEFDSQLNDAFERRRARKGEEDAEVASEPSGLFIRFIDRRRNVRGDRISKPLVKFISMHRDEVPGIGEDHAVWRLVSQKRPPSVGEERPVDASEKSPPGVNEKKSPGTCFYFTRPGARELFKDIFRSPAFKARTVVSITQVAMLDVTAMLSGASKKVKGKGYDTQVLAIATEIADEVFSAEGQPCKCCWTVDVGGLGETAVHEDEAARDDGRDDQEPKSPSAPAPLWTDDTHVGNIDDNGTSDGDAPRENDAEGKQP